MPIKADGTRSDMPVLVNLFGTVKRVAMGVTMGGVERRDGRSLREVGELLAQLRQPEPPRSLSEAMELLPLAKTAMSMKPKTGGGVFSGTPACQQVVLKGADIDLAKLPVQTCWPGEPAPLITWPLIVTKGPGDAREDNFNLGIYRLQVIGQKPDADALAETSRRRAASRALGKRKTRAAARGRRARRRSRARSSPP